MCWFFPIYRWLRHLVTPEHKIPILHIMKSPPSFPWIHWWMSCSHPSPTSNLPEDLITHCRQAIMPPPAPSWVWSKPNVRTWLLVQCCALNLSHLAACSRMVSKTQQSGFIPRTTGTGPHFSIPQALSMMSVNFKRTYFKGQLLFK